MPVHAGLSLSCGAEDWRPASNGDGPPSEVSEDFERPDGTPTDQGFRGVKPRDSQLFRPERPSVLPARAEGPGQRPHREFEG